MSGEPGASFCCEVCGDEPTWEIVRQGDAVVTWACDEKPQHLHWIMLRLQRDFEVTELHVKLFKKQREIVEINRMINRGFDARQ